MVGLKSPLMVLNFKLGWLDIFKIKYEQYKSVLIIEFEIKRDLSSVYFFLLRVCYDGAMYLCI